MQSAPPALSERFRDAAALAHEVHGSQRRAGTQIPYLAHLLVVTGLVIEDGGDEDQALAAMLHDAVEDGGGRSMLERIAQTFGLRRRPGPLTEDLRRAVDEPTDLFARDGHQDHERPSVGLCANPSGAPASGTAASGNHAN